MSYQCVWYACDLNVWLRMLAEGIPDATAVLAESLGGAECLEPDDVEALTRIGAGGPHVDHNERKRSAVDGMLGQYMYEKNRQGGLPGFELLGLTEEEEYLAPGCMHSNEIAAVHGDPAFRTFSAEARNCFDSLSLGRRPDSNVRFGPPNWGFILSRELSVLRGLAARIALSGKSQLARESSERMKKRIDLVQQRDVLTFFG